MAHETKWVFGWMIPMKSFITWCNQMNVSYQDVLYDSVEYEEFIPTSIQFVYACPYEGASFEEYTLAIHIVEIDGLLESFQDLSGETLEEAQTFLQKFVKEKIQNPRIHTFCHST
jgi:hypothetical protein